MTGRIYQLQSMSAVDGPGLRYVVFLQGCPVRCSFCHNADSWDAGAGTPMEAQEVLAKIDNALPYLKNGGVTLSGGEPLLQPQFCGELLRALKERGVHTAVQTSGMGGTAAWESVFPLCDLVMLDLKGTTQGEYGQITRNTARLDQALAALEFMLTHGCAVWVRQVILPGINDTQAHMERLARLLAPYPATIRVQLLHYHTMGVGKWSVPSPLAGLPAMDGVQVKDLQAMLDGLRAQLNERLQG